jgi:pyrimidine deaminase RibD-like protein
MTHEEAIIEAQKRWGNGSAEMIPMVGCVVMKSGETMGIGHSWEEAFLDADQGKRKLRAGAWHHGTRA